MVTGIMRVPVAAVLGLLAALLIGGPLAASASASLPEFSGPFPKAFTSTSKTVTVETVSKLKATCTAATDAGTIEDAKTGTVVIKLTGCKALGFECSSSGAKAGEIVTNTLVNTLGYINAQKKEVGLDVSAPATGAPFTEFTCDGYTITVRGSVIGELTPVNKTVKAGKKVSLKFKQSKGKQKPTNLEGGPTDVLSGSVEGGPSEEAGLKLTDALTFSEAIEIHA